MGLEASMIEIPTRDESLLALTGGRSDIDCVGTSIPGSRLISSSKNGSAVLQHGKESWAHKSAQ